MDYRYLGIPVVLAVLWVGYHLIRNAQEHARVQRLPRAVSIKGPYTAKDGVPEAKRIAALWDPACELQSIWMAFGGDSDTNDNGMGIDGKPIPPSGWLYRFFSARRGWFLDLALFPDGRCQPSSFNGINYLDSQPLLRNYIDSSEAIAIAERLHGKRMRDDGVVFRLPTRLTTWRQNSVRGPVDPVPNRATWQIEYLTYRGTERLDLFLTLDAATGKELAAVEAHDSTVRVITDNFSMR